MDEASALVTGQRAILDNVMKQMLREIVNQSINALVNNYMRHRTKKAITEGENPLDPIARLAAEMMDKVMR